MIQNFVDLICEKTQEFVASLRTGIESATIYLGAKEASETLVYKDYRQNHVLIA
jgi:hypothetical protein